jgi:hypothetical protein
MPRPEQNPCKSRSYSGFSACKSGQKDSESRGARPVQLAPVVMPRRGPEGARPVRLAPVVIPRRGAVSLKTLGPGGCEGWGEGGIAPQITDIGLGKVDAAATHMVANLRNRPWGGRRCCEKYAQSVRIGDRARGWAGMAF